MYRSDGLRTLFCVILVCSIMCTSIRAQTTAMMNEGAETRRIDRLSPCANLGLNASQRDDLLLPACRLETDCRGCRKVIGCSWCNRATDGPCVNLDFEICPGNKPPLEDLTCEEHDCSDVYFCGNARGLTRGECVAANNCTCKDGYKSDPDVGCAYCPTCVPPTDNTAAIVGGTVGGICCLVMVIGLALVLYLRSGGDGSSKDSEMKSTSKDEKEKSVTAGGEDTQLVTGAQVAAANQYDSTGAYWQGDPSMTGTYDQYGGTTASGQYDNSAAAYAAQAYASQYGGTVMPGSYDHVPNQQYGAVGYDQSGYGDASMAGGYAYQQQYQSGAQY